MSDVERIALSWDDISKDSKTLAEKMLAGGMMTSSVKGFIALARGGMSVGQLLAYYLDVRRVECLSVVGYQDMEKIDQKINGTPSPEIGDGEGWIVVDDLVDTGRSFRFVKTVLTKATFVAVYAKPEGLDDAQLTVKTFAQDTWLDFPWEVDPIK